MAVGFGPVDGKQKLNSTFTVVKKDGTVLAQCNSEEEAKEKKISISQAINEELEIKERKLI